MMESQHLSFKLSTTRTPFASAVTQQLTSSLIPSGMTSIATSLLRALPKPKYTGENEEGPVHAQPKGPRVLGAGLLDETQIVLKVKMPLHFICLVTDWLSEDWTASIWTTVRLAPSLSRRLWRWRGISRDPGSTVSTRHGP